ncbi:MAG: hydrogenase maturation protease [bacterium]
MNFDSFKKIFEGVESSRIVFVGLGNKYRSDDSSGIIFLNMLKAISFFEESGFIEAGTNPENYLEKILILNPAVVVFIDAADYGGSPGEIRLMESEKIDSLGFSTHTYSIKIIEEYLSAHGEIKFHYIGIQPLSTEYGKEVSLAVGDKINDFFDGNIF